MIVKSMSRKVPSFGQLIGYIDRDEDAERYRIRHNLAARDPELVRHEFETNASLLQKRKNGVYLYHEILSISRAQGLSDEQQKERLYQIAQQYIAARCPDNLVYGGLHHDKEHSFHFHLMMSSNRAGDTKRLRLDKSQFRDIQVKLEEHVLREYPELEQKLAIGKRSDRRLNQAEVELERRTGQRPQRQSVLERVQEALASSRDRYAFLSALGRSDLELYVRGKNLGVIDLESGKKHRINTLDPELMAPFEERLLKQAEEREKTTPDGEKENRAEAEPVRHNEEKAASREASGEKEQKEARMKQRPQEPILQTPSPERKQKIERDEIEPDLLRDKMSHEDWRKRDTFGHKLSASIRRTGSDIEKALKKDRAPEQQKPQPTKAPPDRQQHPNDRKESQQQKSWREEIDKSRGKSGSEKDRGRE